MSSVVRVKTIEIEIQNLKQSFVEHQFLGASLNGISYLEVDLKFPKIICLGNEANGLSSNVLDQCNQLINIPSKTLGAESLNVGIAAGILMAHFI
jgi:tRNA G18 (ribose-2'-O)-methylase SpoU